MQPFCSFSRHTEDQVFSLSQAYFRTWNCTCYPQNWLQLLCWDSLGHHWLYLCTHNLRRTRCKCRLFVLACENWNFLYRKCGPHCLTQWVCLFGAWSDKHLLLELIESFLSFLYFSLDIRMCFSLSNSLQLPVVPGAALKENCSNCLSLISLLHPSLGSFHSSFSSSLWAALCTIATAMYFLFPPACTSPKWLSCPSPYTLLSLQSSQPVGELFAHTSLALTTVFFPFLWLRHWFNSAVIPHFPVSRETSIKILSPAAQTVTSFTLSSFCTKLLCGKGVSWILKISDEWAVDPVLVSLQHQCFLIIRPSFCLYSFRRNMRSKQTPPSLLVPHATIYP